MKGLGEWDSEYWKNNIWKGILEKRNKFSLFEFVAKIYDLNLGHTHI